MKERLTSLNKPKVFIHFAISLVIMIVFRLLPAPEPITEMGMQIVGIFFAMVYAWITVDTLISSLFYMVMLGATTDYKSVLGVLQAGLGSSAVLLIFLVMILASVFTLSGAAKFVAGKIIKAKIGRGRPYVLLALIGFASYVVGCLTSAVVATLMMWSIVYGIAEFCGYKQGDKWPICACCVAWFAQDRGYIALPFRPTATQGLSVYEALSGSEVSFLSYAVWSVVTSIVSIALLILFTKFVVKPDVSKLVNYSENSEAVPKSSTYQRIIIIVMAVLCLGLTIPSVLPDEWFITKIFSSLGSQGVVIICLVFLLLANFKGGVSFEKMVESVKWKPIFLVAAGIAVAAAMASDEAGVIQFLVDKLGPMVGSMSPFAFIAIMYVLIAVITQFCNSNAVVAAFTPVCYALAEGSGLLESNPFVGPMLATMVVFAASTAVLTPAGSGAAGLVHGNTQWIVPGKIRTQYLLLMPGIAMVVGIVIGYPLGLLVF